MKTLAFLRCAASAFAAAALVSLSTAHAAGAPENLARPVIVGQDGADAAACGVTGEVRGLREEGGLRLSVLAGPDAAAPEIDRLNNGAAVLLCDSSRDGRWSGIVYPATGQTLADCGVATPVSRKSPYRGPCRSGWVATTFVVATTG